MLTMDDEEPVRPLSLTLPLGGGRGQVGVTDYFTAFWKSSHEVLRSLSLRTPVTTLRAIWHTRSVSCHGSSATWPLDPGSGCAASLDP